MLLPPAPGTVSDNAGAGGESYGAILLPAGASALDVIGSLRPIRFTGWVAPPADGWLVVLGAPGDGVVAATRRGVIEVAEHLAASYGTVLAIRVRRDRQLAIVAWRDGEEVARYCSDPSVEPAADDGVLSEPVGAEDASAIAALCDRPDAAEKLTELLEDELDAESVFESERLIAVLRMLALPSWIVASAALPRDIPTGPRAAELTRLRAGATGAAGVVRNIVVSRFRRRRTPPPVIDDPPRSDMSGIEPWML